MIVDKLHELIVKVSKHPELYLGKPSLERLYAFIGGFLYQNANANYKCLDGFNQYIADIYDIKSDHNWASIIQFYSSTEEDAFSAFVKHFNDFTHRES